ncbi:MAG: DinB family protein [Candidatus Rokubacteria bacterium]|nr:DinB family protein [Candidatus Rokubacteria bacterium]
MTDDARREAQARVREYFRTRGTLAPYALRDRIAAAFDAFETAVAPLPAADAARASLPGEWTVHEIVDHLVETHRLGLDELWCLLAGRRPPGAPIPAGLQSKAPLARPWPWLLRALRHPRRAGRRRAAPLDRGPRLEGLRDHLAAARARSPEPGPEGPGRRAGLTRWRSR